jgi:hypothetical protein
MSKLRAEFTAAGEFTAACKIIEQALQANSKSPNAYTAADAPIARSVNAIIGPLRLSLSIP